MPISPHHHPRRSSSGEVSATIATIAGIVIVAGMVGAVVAFFVLGSSSSVTSTTSVTTMPSATVTPGPSAPAPLAPPAASVDPRPTPAAERVEPPQRDEQLDVQLTGAPLVTPAGRPAIPQPGEAFDEPLPAVRLVPEPAEAPTVAADDAPPGETPLVPWDQAARHVGKTITAEGKIVRAYNTGKVCFLNFVDQHPSDAFYLIVFQDVLDSWPEPPQDYFMNKTVRATGRVFIHKGKPQIRIEKAEQLVVVQ